MQEYAFSLLTSSIFCSFYHSAYRHCGVDTKRKEKAKLFIVKYFKILPLS